MSKTKTVSSGTEYITRGPLIGSSSPSHVWAKAEYTIHGFTSEELIALRKMLDQRSMTVDDLLTLGNPTKIDQITKESMERVGVENHINELKNDTDKRNELTSELEKAREKMWNEYLKNEEWLRVAEERLRANFGRPGEEAVGILSTDGSDSDIRKFQEDIWKGFSINDT